MTTNMKIVHSTSTIDDFISTFTGREGFYGYDATKLIKLDDIQRGCVWTIGWMEQFIINILQGFPTPGIVICNSAIIDGGNRSTAEKLFISDKIKISIGAFDGTYSDLRSDETHALAVGDAPRVAYTPEYIRDRSLFRRQWDRHQVPVTTITGATDDEKADIYDRYNRGMVTTLGQQLDARTHYPIVDLALAMIGHSKRGTVFPFIDLYRRVFQNSWKKTITRRELAFAFQVLVASWKGRDHFHTKFTQHLKSIKDTTAEQQINTENLRLMCEIIASADPDMTAQPRKKAAAFKKFIAPMIHDAWEMTTDELTVKWKQFFADAYTILTTEQLKALVNVGTARASTIGRIGAVSIKVQEYLDTRLAPIADDDAIDYADDDEDESV